MTTTIESVVMSFYSKIFSYFSLQRSQASRDKELLNYLEISTMPFFSKKVVTEHVQALLDKGANPDCRDAQTGYTPLMLAAENGYTAVVKTLAEAKANIHATNINGDSALSLAVLKNRVINVAILMDYGANPAPIFKDPLALTIIQDSPTLQSCLLPPSVQGRQETFQEKLRALEDRLQAEEEFKKEAANAATDAELHAGLKQALHVQRIKIIKPKQSAA